MNRSSLINWVILLVVIAGAIWIVKTRRPREISTDLRAAIGKPLAALRLAPLTMDGDEVTLDDLRGEVALVNFWGTWCQPCIEEFPHLAKLEKKLHDRDGFRFLSVSCGAGEEVEADLKEETLAFLESEPFGAGVYWDPAGFTREAVIESTKAGFGYPFTVLIDREGKIAALWSGYVEGYALEMEHAIAKLLKK
jgi:thiol-disulfide isomerase/thioredoxin